MERQRSFSFKPTRLLMFCFTISSSIICIFFFTFWVIKSTPPVRQEVHIEFNSSSLRAVTVQTLTGLSRNSSASGVKNSVLVHTQFRKPQNISGSGQISDIRELQREKNELPVLEDEENKNGNFIGDSPSMEDSVPGISSEKIEVSSGEKIEEKNVTANTTNFDISIGKMVEEKKTEESSPEKPIVSSGEKIEEKNVTANTTNFDISIGKMVEEKKAEESSPEKPIVSSIEKIEKRIGKCDVTKGRWIYDENYPLYTNFSCPFIDEGFNCVGNGRSDKDYMKWRWQPENCEIPRFNATKMLELMRGKRLVFVGDSINRNQWESMLCMLMGAIKDPKKVYETHGRRITKDKGDYSFRFVDYKCTVEYYVTHFLVHEGKARLGQKRVQTLRIDSIDRGSSRWKGADVLVFNTAHWWTHYKTKAGINYYQEGGQVHPRLDVSTAFRKALTTWATWVDRRINPGKTRVFFRSSSPSHFRGGQWNSGGHCKEATRPLSESPSSSVSEKNMIVEEVIQEMKTPVTVLNITSLSEYRIDGHPSAYGKTGKQSGQDCSHWCLPGVPDSWNELLYAHLQMSKRGGQLVLG